MKYNLILPSGRIMCFFIESVAKLYQSIYSGTLVSESVLVEIEMENENV